MSRARILADYVSSGDELADKAPLASPIFTGTVQIPNISNLETAVEANTNKTGITSGQASAISANTSKVTNSTDASDLTSGTLPIARIADDAVIADKLANSINTDIATGVTAGTVAAAALPKAGGEMTGNTVHGDDIKSTYGDDPDLEIFHDGSNSNVRDVGTGQLRLQGSEVRINANATENSIKALANGAVEFYHDDVKKFETTATGVTATGIVTAASLVLTPGSAPGSPAEGAMYYDTGSKTAFIYDGTNWKTVSSIEPVGGTVTTHGSYTVHSFTSSGFFTTDSSVAVSILVVAGGGEGGNDVGPGGGAGAMAVYSSVTLAAGTYKVTVGAGGGGVAGGFSANAGSLPGNYSQFGNFDKIQGGAGAPYYKEEGNDGGCGSGAGGYIGDARDGGFTFYNLSGITTNDTYGLIYGGNGGKQTYTSGLNYLFPSAGGGGAGGNAPNVTAAVSGTAITQGGDGKPNDYRTGSNVTYCAGGRGSSDQTASNNFTASGVNSGDGGDTGGVSNQGWPGGSGIVVVRRTT